MPQHMMGAGNSAAAKAVWGELESWLDDGNDIINRAERVSTEYAGANIDYSFISDRNDKFLKLRMMMKAFKDAVGLMRNEPDERALGEHNPTMMANDQTNGNLAAMTGRVGNMGMGGGM